jgi:rod shape-determining protein MreD
LTYSALSFLAIGIHRRILWFSVPSQAMQVLPLFIAAHALMLVIRLLTGDIFPGWSVLLAPVLEALLWPLVSVLLLLPQRQAPDPDDNRPL